MNQPRYSDNGSGSSHRGDYPGNRRGVAHSTGRSNYGGGGGPRGRRGIGKWIENRRQRRRQRSNGGRPRAVGTEANAIQNMAANAKQFSYPPEGFITPVEHSLLYAMIEYPDRYPESVVKKEIEEEEFEEYLYVKDAKRKGVAATGDDGGGKGREENDEEGSDQAARIEQQRAEEEEFASYAQLSALAALSAQKNPSTATPEPINKSSRQPNNPPNRTNSVNSGGPSTTAPTITQPETLSIGQCLVRKILKTITRYSDAHGLDRQNEIREFLTPIERRCQLRNEKAALQQLLPAYAGYTLSLVTGNPLPLLIGAAALTQKDPMMEENSNVSGFRAVGGRAGDMETAGLLDECESD